MRAPVQPGADLFSMAETREAVAAWQAERLERIRAERLDAGKRLVRQARAAALHVSSGGEAIRWLLRPDMRDAEWNTPEATVRTLRRAAKAAKVLEVIVSRIGSSRVLDAGEGA
jgi:hypothetical protein